MGGIWDDFVSESEKHRILYKISRGWGKSEISEIRKLFSPDQMEIREFSNFLVNDLKF